MGKGFKTGGSGGGSGVELNFTVTAYLSEVELNTATPEENTVGVVTTNPITGWYFTSEQPENMAEGEVWFPTSTSSAAAFNALNENTIMVYTIGAKQYVSGKWEDKTAKIYQNEKWVDMICLLYDSASGIENTSLLGSGGFSVKTDAAGKEGVGSLSKTSNGITLNSNNSANFIFLSHNDVIDLSPYKTLHVIWSGGYGTDRITCSVHNTNKPEDTFNAVAYVARRETGEYESTLDISAITSGYIVLTAYNSAVTFKKIWMN